MKAEDEEEVKGEGVLPCCWLSRSETNVSCRAARCGGVCVWDDDNDVDMEEERLLEK